MLQNNYYETSSDSPKPNSNPPDWYAPLERPDWWLVIIAAFTGGVICWQSRETRRAANASEKAAEASLFQANHIVASERGWITITPSDRSPQLYPAWETGSALPPSNPVMHRMPLTVQNVGKTPAQIDQAAFHYIRIASLTDLPDEPDYGELAPQGGHWIIPNDKHNAGSDLETDQGILYQRHIQDLELRCAYLFAFGIMKYRDAFGKPHETRVGYVYHFPIKGIVSADGTDLSKPYFRIDGPPKYNYAD